MKRKSQSCIRNVRLNFAINRMNVFHIKNSLVFINKLSSDKNNVLNWRIGYKAKKKSWRINIHILFLGILQFSEYRPTPWTLAHTSFGNILRFHQPLKILAINLISVFSPFPPPQSTWHSFFCHPTRLQVVVENAIILFRQKQLERKMFN